MERVDGIGAASALQWWADAGVDTIVADEPRDWLNPKAKAPSIPAARLEEEELPGQLELFRGWLASSDRLPFASPSAPRICPSGDPASGLMILTDMPSTEDCAAGALISGDSGLLFDRMLAAIGRGRDSVYLAALSCFRSPAGTIDPANAKACADIARHHAGLAAPKALLLFGDACSKALLGLAVAQARGRWHDLDTPAGPIKALVTLSPDYLLRHPAQKKIAWIDLQLLMEGLSQ